MKPIVLASALQARWPHLGPDSIVLDVALTVEGAGPGGRAWSPRNWDGRFRGPMTLRRATELSRNLPFVRLGMNTGLDRLVETAHAMGITSPLKAVPSLCIGSQELSPLELAVAYATLANGGTRVEPRFLEGVRARDGVWLERSTAHSRVGIDPRVAAVVTDLLSGVVERGTAAQVRRAGFTLPVAAKTGTSNGSRDGWMVGYTPDLVVVAWVGFDQDRSLGLPSSRTAVPLWTEFMLAAEPFLSGDEFSRPAGLGTLLDDPLEGDLFAEDSHPPESAAKPSARNRRTAKSAKQLRREDQKRRRSEARALRAMD
jgi:penicillin-binding protein 1B